MNEVKVHVDQWDGPPVQAGEVAWNAPRPLFGRAWEGEFRHGVFYAITGPDDRPDLAEKNAQLDGWPVRFVTNAEVEAEILQHLAEYDYTSPKDAGYTFAELAAQYGLPYVEAEP